MQASFVVRTKSGRARQGKGHSPVTKLRCNEGATDEQIALAPQLQAAVTVQVPKTISQAA